MNSLKTHIQFVYPNQSADGLLESIQQLIAKYSNQTAAKKLKLSEKDVVLITYGDQVSKKGMTPLSALQKLVTEELKNEISIIHLLPFFPFSSDDGFSVIDYYEVNPEAGSWADIQTLNQNFLLLFDAVINHSSKSCDWFQKFLKSEKDFREFYVEWEPKMDVSQVVRPRISPLFHNFDSELTAKKVWTTFSEDQVDLNFKNPKVLLRILDVLLYYVSKGASIIRLDAVGFMWKASGTSCLHLPQTHALIKLMKLVLQRVNPDVMLLTETNVPHQENISYFGDGDEADMVYNFTLPPLLAYSMLSEQVTELTQWLTHLEVPYSEVCYFNFLASHDGIGMRPVDGILSESQTDVLLEAAENNGGVVSYKSNADGSKTPYEINCNYYSLLKGPNQNEALGLKRFILANAFLLSMPGLPALYFHSIFGSENDIEGMKASQINRRINREKTDLDVLQCELNDPNHRRSQVLNAIRKLIRLRKSQTSFNPYAKFEVNRLSNSALVLTRISDRSREKIHCCFNFSGHPFRGSFAELNKTKDLVSGQVFSNPFTIEPYGFRWLKETP